ncbi:unnamed protein product [Protopolystoma xenopodis]|uniref:Bestrophin homolog n=1 Tax=Protopolystoma xenopodis TaxID=117903 RepID=A0A3S5ABL8_9PLAT|nr:unnamed protein product [Protopolystoma xenopodis]
MCYTTINRVRVPLEVVIIAVYSYFLCQIFASQFVAAVKDHSDEHRVDFYFPIFSIFSFLFLMGWLKVALCVMNPFGDDDEDFQTSDILDYNLEISYRCVFLDENTFPKRMGMPLGKGSSVATEANNDLIQFLNSIDQEMQEINPEKPLNEYVLTDLKAIYCLNIQIRVYVISMNSR